MKKTGVSVKEWQERIVWAAFPKKKALVDFILNMYPLAQCVSEFTKKTKPKEVTWLLLSRTVRNGDFRNLRRLVRFGLSLKTTDVHSQDFHVTLMHIAAENGRSEIVKYLLEQNIKPDAGNFFGQTPLMMAATSGSLESALTLVRSGADIDDFDNACERTPLGLAIYVGDLEMVQLLVKEGANFNEEHYNEQAARSGNIDVFNYIAQLDDDWFWDDIINEAAASGSIEMVRHVLDCGHTRFRYTPLTEATKACSLEMIDYLVSPEFTDRLADDQPKPTIPWEGMIYDAFDSGDPSMLEWAFDSDASLAGEFGSSLMNRLYNKSQIPMIEVLLAHGCDINHSDHKGQTALFHLTYDNNAELARFLIEHGADVNHRDNAGNTPLQVMTAETNTAVVRLLIKHGADPNAVNKRRVIPSNPIPDCEDEEQLEF